MNYRNTTFNSMAFTPDEVKKGLLDKFVKTLNDLNQDKEQGFIEYHVTTDGFCTIVEFDDLFIRDEDDKFQYVDENDWKDEDIALTEEEKELAAKHCKKDTDTIEEVEDDTPCCEDREKSEDEKEPFLEECTEEEWNQYINGLWTKIAKLHVHN